MAGVFITLEGGEGSGKSTQAQLLKSWFAEAFPGREILVTREPGGTEQAEEIRAILVNGATDKLSVQAEALLMIAARTEHVQKIIQPALRRDAIVICDRFSDSTLVYQGLAHDKDITLLRSIPSTILRMGLCVFCAFLLTGTCQPLVLEGCFF